MLDSMGIDVTPRLKVEKVEAPTERSGGVIVKDVDELLAKLRNEAKLLWGVSLWKKEFIKKEMMLMVV